MTDRAGEWRGGGARVGGGRGLMRSRGTEAVKVKELDFIVCSVLLVWSLDTWNGRAVVNGPTGGAVRSSRVSVWPCALQPHTATQRGGTVSGMRRNEI